MSPRPIIPIELQSYYDDWKMSPGLACDGFVFFSGFTGARIDGSISKDPEKQIRQAFWKVNLVLQESGLTAQNIVEMTTYHIGLRDHLDLFRSIRSEFVEEPYPAWTAIEVAGFVREDAIIEIRIIAQKP